MDSLKVLNGTGGGDPRDPREAAPGGAPARLELAEVRERLRNSKGPDFWRSLDELAETPEFQDMLHREFPRHASEWVGDVSRRRFLQLSGASLALAGLTGCTRQPLEKIVPYVKQPEYVIPGKPLYFATAHTMSGYALGVLAESHMGRPTKIEGNPDHPASLGATDAFAQASVLTLYDPERSQSVLGAGRIGTWTNFVSEVGARMRALGALRGEGVRFLTGTVTSPTLAGQMQGLLEKYPAARWHRWEAAGRHQAHRAAERAFGRPLEVRYDFTQADVVLSVDSDFFTLGPGSVRYSKDFSRHRRELLGRGELSRLYAVESVPTTAAMIADHRLSLPPAEIAAFVLALAQALGVAGAAGAGIGGEVTDPKARLWVEAVAEDLRANAGRSLVVVDEFSAPAVQVLVYAINEALGNVGRTVAYTEPVEVDPVDHVESLRELVADMAAGRVEALVMLGVNPVYTAPADLPFVEALARVPLKVHHGLYVDETARYCDWHVPATHELESWSDARAFDGTATVIQPLIEPLYDGRSIHEVVSVFDGRIDATAYELVREFWQRAMPAGDFETGWRRILHEGVVPDTGYPPVSASVAGAAEAAREVAEALRAARALAGQPGPNERQVTLVFRPDPTIYDGSLANNAWLQELPKPLTKLTWDNALVVSPATAERLGAGMQETVEITFAGRKLAAAVWILPGMAPGTAMLTLGYGRERPGEPGFQQGFNAYRLRGTDSLWLAPGAEVRPLGDAYPFACTQNHHALEPSGAEQLLAGEAAMNRHLIRTGTLEEFRENPQFIQEARHKPGPEEGLYPEYEYKGNAWGMGIDLNACTGCGACVVACQSENNIPVVGKDQVIMGREMHWLRIDRYFAGDVDDPEIHCQPVPCMHCEKAPCEVVCPVAATVHSDEGLNDMVYNRCVGTRYCSNNCPYKVRRFNFFRYSDSETPVLELLHNPDVTVRMRGVMEKCTYCVQRIEQHKIEAKVEDREIVPGRLQTACQQACPTEAIVFGNVNDPAWEVTQWKASPLNYALLEELNTQPRTSYLAKLRNPNPRLAALEAERNGHGHA